MMVLVSKNEYEQLKATLRQRAQRNPSSPFEERFEDFLTVGIYHFIGGTQDFARWSLKMQEDFGEWIRPHVQQIWLGMPGEARKIADRLLAPILKHVEITEIEMDVSQFAVIKRASVGKYRPPPQQDVRPAAPTQHNRARRTVSKSGDLTHETESLSQAKIEPKTAAVISQDVRSAPHKQELRPDSSVPARQSMVKRIKSLLGSAAGMVFIALLILIPLAALYGLVWLTAKLYPLAAGIAVLATLVLIFVLLPASLLKRNRHWCGTGVTYVSYAWGIALWMFATLVLYSLWGIFGLILGFALLGVGSVPLACVALLFAARFKWLGLMLLGTALVFAVRFLGVWLASGEEAELETVFLGDRLLPYRWGKFFAVFSGLSSLGMLYLGLTAVEASATTVAVITFALAALTGVQAWGLFKKRKIALIAFYVLCAVSVTGFVLSYIHSLEWGEPGDGLGAAVLYLGSLPYFLRRRSEFGRNQHSATGSNTDEGTSAMKVDV